jgi:undecaprenyl-diphosphatase
METWFAALLGLIQGLTEFIPVSSTAHLRIAPALLDQPDPGAAFSAVIQLGTLLAVVIYFARDLFIDMPRAMFRDRSSQNARMPIYLAVGTVPIVVLGLAGKDFITGSARSLYVVAGALVAVALVMIAVERFRRPERGIETLRLFDVVAIGVAQSLALCPGVSRSGATIVCALLLGFRRSDAARFSFLLGIPAIAGALVLEGGDVAALAPELRLPLAVGIATAYVTGLAAIALLLRVVRTGKLQYFAYYCWTIGILVATAGMSGAA